MIKITVITSLYNCYNYIQSFLQQVALICNKDECEFLLLHNAPQQKELDVIQTFIVDKPYIRHIIIPERESLYATWNRGCQMAKGKYIAIWNVDDIRTPESLLMQSKALDCTFDAVYAHGSFILVEKYGDKSGVLIEEPDTKNAPKAKIYRHLGGCFPMWRKAVHDSIGFMDEQFKLAGDYDFQCRVGLKYDFVKVNHMLGYYLMDSPTRLSKNSRLQQTECNLIHRRYKLNSIVNPFYSSLSKNLDVDNIHSFGKIIPLVEYRLPIKSDINNFLLYAINFLFKFPYQLAKYIKHEILKL